MMFLRQFCLFLGIQVKTGEIKMIAIPIVPGVLYWVKDINHKRLIFAKHPCDAILKAFG